MSNSEIISSTGRLGLEKRTFARYYFNQHKSLNFSEISRLKMLGEKAIKKQREKHTRAVGRFILKESDVQKLLENQFPIEAIVPTEIIHEKERLFMVLGAINHPSRQKIHDNYQVIQEEMQKEQKMFLPLGRRVQLLREQGFTFLSTIPNHYEKSLLGLWQETFGWDQQSISALSSRIAESKKIPQARRDIWVSLLINPDDELVAAAMAERLDFHIYGKNICIVESTEWKRSDAFQHQKGLMIATLGFLHANILEDLHSLDSPPLLIAETNVMSRSDRAGRGAGLILANTTFRDYTIPQYLVQNVEVRDGYTPEGLRDFFMMYLPPENRDMFYNEDQRNLILQYSV